MEQGVMDTETVETVEPTESEVPALNIQEMSDKIGAELFPPTEPEPEGTPSKEEPTFAAPVGQESLQPPSPTVKTAPKTWPKEMHEHWGKVDPKVQEYLEKREKQMLEGLDQYKGAAQYGKVLQEVIAPFQATLQAKGLDAPRAVQSLLQAHQRLTSGTPEQRQAAYRQLGENLGFTTGPTTTEPTAPIDPTVKQLQEQFQQIQQVLTAQQQEAFTAARTKASQEVEAFASDPKNALFDECYEDIVKFIKAGDSLQEAYDRAVWANPVTREKSVQARLQTETEKAKENARLTALPKLKAKSVNVRGRDTLRTPTEPIGSIEDTARATLREMRSRTAH